MNDNNESSKNENKPKLRFDPTLHDSKVEARLSEGKKAKARSLISKAYAEWKRRLQRRIKKGEKLTRQQLIAELYDLQSVVKREADGPEMYEWRQFALELIDDHVSVLILSEGWKLNVFAEFAVDGLNYLSLPQRYTFSTVEELMDLKPIKPLKDKVGFIGLVREQRVLFAMYQGGEMVPVGTVLKVDDQVKRLPTVFEIKRELEKLPEE